MTQGPRGSDTESRYLALINSLTEAGNQFDSLGVPGQASEMLLDLINVCRRDFGKRFR